MSKGKNANMVKLQAIEVKQEQATKETDMEIGKLIQGDVARIFRASNVVKITNKYSFSFECDEGECHLWHENGRLKLQADGEACNDFVMLIKGVEELVKRTKALDVSTAVQFLCKYLKMKWRIARELERTPISEGELVASNVQPMDLESLPLEERAVAEVLQELFQEAERTGTVGKIHSIDNKMVDAKLEEIKRHQKQQC
jgi:hypothetical protein